MFLLFSTWAQIFLLPWILYNRWAFPASLFFFPDFPNPVFSIFYTCSHPFLLYLKLKRIIHSIPCGLQNLPYYHSCGQVQKAKTWCDDVQSVLICSAPESPKVSLCPYRLSSLQRCCFPTTVLSYLLRWFVWKFLIMTPNFDLAHSLFQNILTFVNLFTLHLSVLASQRSFVIWLDR